MNVPAIQLQQASVEYRHYAHPRDALLEWLLRRPRHVPFYALHNLDLQLAAGDSLGVIGDNGAGKSTLLKMLAGTIPPTAGQCLVQGRRSALLELGSGMQPDFSGVDNARMGLALRGLVAREIEQKLPEVLAFAELGAFAQQAVKTYSSGMLVRLVFAIAAVIEPDVLIVDEALSVGDQYFQKKSLDRMRGILQRGATLVFCSHNLYQVREMCRQAVWLEQGKIRLLGDAQTVVDAYQDAVRARATPATNLAPQRIKEPANGSGVYLRSVQLNQPQFQTWDKFVVTVQVNHGNHPLHDIHVGIVIRRNDGIQCFGISTLHDGVPLYAVDAATLGTQFVLEQLPLLSGEYCLEVWLIDSSGVHVYDSRERCCHFRVQQAAQAQGIGVAWLPHRWAGKEQADALAV